MVMRQHLPENEEPGMVPYLYIANALDHELKRLHLGDIGEESGGRKRC